MSRSLASFFRQGFFEGTIRNINKVQKQEMPEQFEELK